MRRSLPVASLRPALALLALLAALCGLLAGSARGERTQYGNVIVSLDGGLSPLTLPRDRPAPVAVRLEGGLQTSDGSTLPRVTRIKLGMPGEGIVDVQGLPRCKAREIRDTTVPDALAACSDALVGRGKMGADVLVPGQPAFRVEASLHAFNARVEGRRAVLLHAFAAEPPTVVVLPFLFELRPRKFGTTLVADLPGSLGPWPHFAHFEMSFFRSYEFRGEQRSYLSASCPTPPRLTAGFLAFAKATFTLDGGRKISTEIARSCRARS